MARLIYAALTSLDGYIADEAGNFDWAVPDEPGALLHQRPRAAHRPVSLRAQDVRDHGELGDTLAGHAIRAGLVDEYHLFVAPIVVGGGKPFLPGNVRMALQLLDQRGFDHGMVHIRYRAKDVEPLPGRPSRGDIQP